MSTRPYKLFGTSERARIEDLVSAAAKAWREVWLPAGAPLRTEWAPASGAARRFPAPDSVGWLTFAAGDSHWAMAAERGVIAALAAALCGVADVKARPGYAGESGIAGEAARRALRHLAAGLLRVPPESVRAREDDGAPAAHAWEKGSASIALWLALGDTTLRFVSSPGWALQLLSERQAKSAAAARLESRRHAVTDRAVTLQVVAGWVELELGVLRGLSPGNIIALGTRIDTPLSIVGAGRSVPMFRGKLGSAQGRRAVALVGGR